MATTIAAPTPAVGGVSRRGWVLFSCMGVIWGLPYLLIKVAVDELEPAVVVFGRTSIAGVVLLLIAGARGDLRPALRRWRPVLAFAVLEMAIPWILLTDAERHLSSGLTGMLVCLVPIFGAVTAFALGDHTALRPVTVAGIAVGVGGVALLVGHDLRGSGVPVGSVVEVVLVCVGYAVAPFILSRRLADVPRLGIIAVSIGAVAVVYAPLAWLARPAGAFPVTAGLAVAALAVVCTGVAFVLFFALIAEVGPNRATLITFVNPAVAVLLGAAVLDETVTAATFVGFALVLTGCWFATRPAAAPAGPADPAGAEAPTSR